MRRIFCCLCLVLVVAAVATAQEVGRVSVYVSLDEEFSRSILEDFGTRHNIDIEITPDTEDNKTIGLVNRIISEKENPRCDVYWNNELGQTIRLKNRGLTQAYHSPSAADIPDAFKDPEGHWTGFAARARVFIYNTTMLSADELPSGLADLTDPKWAGKVTMAKPLTGTTLTNLGALFTVWGEEKTKAWVDELLASEMYWNKGNAQVMRDVGEGRMAWGFTDTDDAHVSRYVKGHPTDIVVPGQGEGGMGTLLIPNSVLIVKDAKNLENAKKLVDFILSTEVESKLARGRSAQIPLRSSVKVPPGVLRLDKVRAIEVDWEAVGRALEDQNAYLHERFQGGDAEAGTKSQLALWLIGIPALLAVFFTFYRRKSAAQ